MNRRCLIPFVCCLMVASCVTSRHAKLNKAVVDQKSIVILFENDVHCGIDGYTKLAGLRDAIASADTAYVGVTSSGDFINGGVAGAISRGQYIVDIMRSVGYDAIGLGNHEFDFGTPRLLELMPQAGAPVICANLFKAGGTQPIFPAYTMKTFGQKRVAFIGVCTPESMQAEAYSFYDKDGRQLYDLRTKDVFRLVQAAVDSVRAAGADYVVVLAHLGEDVSDTGVDSHSLISHTRGIDVVLDGHTHSVIPHDTVDNLENRKIGVSQTGTQFANIGKLVISSNGVCSTSLVPIGDVPYSNPRVTAVTDSVKALMAQKADRVIGSCDFELTINGADGKRLVRNGETNLGDLCADAFRHRMGADIGLQNGGGVRNNIPAGTITFGSAIGVLPFYNLTCKIEATGRQIVETMEKCTEKYPAEDGSFPHVAGMRFTLHAASHRITDVEVLNRETGVYEPILLDRKYTIATSDYYANGGFCDMLKTATLLEQTTEQLCDTFADFIAHQLGGKVGDAYRLSQGRITIVKD